MKSFNFDINNIRLLTNAILLIAISRLQVSVSIIVEFARIASDEMQ